MFPALLTRLLRRRILMLPIVLSSCLILYLWLHNEIRKNTFFTEQTFQRTRPLIWRTLQEHVDETNNRTNNFDETCRNSIQGRNLLVDDRGFVCERNNILSNGCCDVEIPDTEIMYYTCSSCNKTTNCCSVYEYCVSCCLHPQKKPLLEEVLLAASRRQARQAALYVHLSDHFELCLVKCRTSSHSVEHENKYRAKEKFCYGLTEAHESQRAVLENVN